MTDDGDEDHHHGHDRRHRGPAQPHLELSSGHEQLAAEQAEGREPEQGHEPDAEHPTERGRRASSARTPSIWLVPSAAMISPEVRNNTLLARPWPRMWSNTAAMASGMPAAAPRAMSPMCSMLW